KAADDTFNLLIAFPLRVRAQRFPDGGLCSGKRHAFVYRCYPGWNVLHVELDLRKLGCRPTANQREVMVGYVACQRWKLYRVAAHDGYCRWCDFLPDLIRAVQAKLRLDETEVIDVCKVRIIPHPHIKRIDSQKNRILWHNFA